jgi:arylsulfatase A-like enzyme
LIESSSVPAHPEGQRHEYAAVRTLRLKYITYPALGGAEELYDLNADPYEMTNLAGRESATNEVRSMRGLLQKLQKEASK